MAINSFDGISRDIGADQRRNSHGRDRFEQKDDWESTLQGFEGGGAPQKPKGSGGSNVQDVFKAAKEIGLDLSGLEDELHEQEPKATERTKEPALVSESKEAVSSAQEKRDRVIDIAIKSGLDKGIDPEKIQRNLIKGGYLKVEDGKLIGEDESSIKFKEAFEKAMERRPSNRSPREPLRPAGESKEAETKPKVQNEATKEPERKLTEREKLEEELKEVDQDLESLKKYSRAAGEGEDPADKLRRQRSKIESRIKEIEEGKKPENMTTEEKITDILGTGSLPENFQIMLSEIEGLKAQKERAQSELNQTTEEEKEHEVAKRILELGKQIKEREAYIIEAAEARKKVDETVREEKPEKVEPKIKEAVNIERATQEAMHATPLGEALYAAIDKERMVPKPRKVGWLSRMYLKFFENSIYTKIQEQEENYKEAQKRLRLLKKAEEGWFKQEYKLMNQSVEAESDYLGALEKIEKGELTKKDWEKLLKITNRLALSRLKIDEGYLGEIAEEVGYKGEMPKVKDWIGFKEKEVKEIEPTVKEELIKSLSEDPKFKVQFLGLDKESQDLFIREEAGGSLRDLATAIAKRTLLTQALREATERAEARVNPFAVYQILENLCENESEVSQAGSRVEKQIGWHQRKAALRGFGRTILQSIKKGVGDHVFGIDPGFEVKFETKLNEIILHGESNLARTSRTIWESAEMTKFVGNRTKRGIVWLRKRFNEGLGKMVEESVKIPKRISRLESEIAGLDEKNEELKYILERIAVKTANDKSAEKLDKYIGRIVEHSKEKEQTTRTVIGELIDFVSPTQSRKEMLTALYKKEFLSEKFATELVKNLQMALVANGREKVEMEAEIKDLETEIALLERKIEKGEESLANNETAEQMTKMLDRKGLLERSRDRIETSQEGVTEDIRLKIQLLRESADKHFVDILRKGFGEAA